MRKKIIFKKVLAGILAISIVGALSACGNTESSGSGKATVIPVGVCSAAKPDAYIDDNGKLTGYDVEVLRAIDGLLPQYELDLQTMEFTEILNGLSTGRILAGSQQFEWNKEREANYLFGKEPLVGYNTFIVTLNKPEYANVTGFADFAGKTTLVSQGGSAEAQVNTWNEKNPDKKLKTVVGGSNIEDYVNFLNNGVVDFLFFTEQSYNYFTANYETKDWVFHENAPVYTSNSFILFGKTQTQLQQDFDGALKQLNESGELAKLSIQFYGKDYTVKSGS